jgi:hypothetical protein
VVVGGGAAWAVVVEVVTGAVELVTGAAGALWAEVVVVDAVEVELFDPPHPATARTMRMGMRTAIAALFIGAR